MKREMVYLVAVVAIPLWAMMGFHKDRLRRWNKDNPVWRGREPSFMDNIGVGYATLVILVIVGGVLHKVFGFPF